MLHYLLLCEALKDQSNIVPMMALMLLLWQRLAMYTTIIIIIMSAFFPYYCHLSFNKAGGALADCHLNHAHDHHLVMLFPQ